MTPDVPTPAPAGFPECGRCAYLVTGTPALCRACAETGAPARSAQRCAVCGQDLVDGACPNTVCRLPDRHVARVHTVSEDAEAMWTAIWRYKYEDERERAQVLGRLLVGYLQEHREQMERYDLIALCALYTGPDAPRLWDYLQLVVEAARREDPRWPFAPGLITKGRTTGRFLGLGVEERRTIAEGELRAALAVPEPERVAGRRVLVFDDVWSEGFSLREMARVLLEAGAVEVGGLVLARRKGG